MHADGGRRIRLAEQCRNRHVGAVVAVPDGDGGSGHAVEFVAQLREPGDPLVGAEPERGNGLLIQIGDAAVAEGDQMPDKNLDGGGVVDADRGVELARRGHVDADDRDTHGVQAVGFVRTEVERGDDDRVGVAAYRQLLEESRALLVMGDGVNREVIAGVVQHRVQPFQNPGGEPVDMPARQQCDAEGLAAFERNGGAGDGEVQLVGHLQHLLPGAFGDQLGAGECAGDRGDGDAGPFGHIVDACFHTSSLQSVAMPLRGSMARYCGLGLCSAWLGDCMLQFYRTRVKV